MCVVLVLALLGTTDVAAAQLVSRDGPDVVTVRANRLNTPLNFDGRLDEDVFSLVEPIHDFVQQEPLEGMPATERTDVWVLFDDTNLYIAARLWDSHPELDIANEMQRDGANYTQNENIVLILDTFHDRRNGYMIQTNKVGGMRDLAIADDRQQDSWNGVWDVKTATSDEGWTAEFVIPFKTLRYRGGGLQEWGFNVRRIVKWKNEVVYLSLVPAVFGGGGVSRMRSAATLVGIETPAESMNLELKPFAVSSLTTDHMATVPFTNDLRADAGIDLKYGLTRGLTADVTVNPDFAQVEEDMQQVNLTRFSLFFPEKRGFFLEGQGIFDFGGVGGNAAQGDVPLMFYSRRIGLSQDQAVPVLAGGRVTGKAGRFTIGALNIETGDKGSAGAVATNFTALRVKREILESSYLGVIGTRRSPGAGGGGATATLGADAAVNFSRTTSATAYLAQTSKLPGVTDGTSSYRVRFDYITEQYGLAAERLMVGAHFTPEVGYAQRPDITKSYVFGRLARRPQASAVVRRLTLQGAATQLSDSHRNVVQERRAQGTFIVDFQNSDIFTLDHTRDYELLPEDFRIATGVVVPAGPYRYSASSVSYAFGNQRRLAGIVSVTSGTLYGGTKDTLAYSSGRLVVTPGRFSIEPGFSLNWVDLPYGNFTQRLITGRFVVTPSPRMLLTTFIQFNQSRHTLSSSLRLKWEYTPGSELFVAYTDGRDTLGTGLPDTLNQTFVIKATRLLRF
ncbi:MAG: hypothetical protein EXR92_05815 [Gemmatimonadetes bacterium]|nr:hypothetical protein [Gemmatimonadota bacterium]